MILVGVLWAISCGVGFGSFVFRWVWGGSMVGVGVCMLLTCCLVWWGVLFGCCLLGFILLLTYVYRYASKHRIYDHNYNLYTD